MELRLSVCNISWEFIAALDSSVVHAMVSRLKYEHRGKKMCSGESGQCMLFVFLLISEGLLYFFGNKTVFSLSKTIPKYLDPSYKTDLDI